MIVMRSCGAVLTGWTNSLSFPVCRDFWHGHMTLSSRGGAAPMSEPHPISGKRIWLGFPPRLGRRRHGRPSSMFPRFWRCIDSGDLWIGTGPYLPRVRRKSPPLMCLYPPRTALGSSNQRLANGIGVPSLCGSVSTRESWDFFPG